MFENINWNALAAIGTFVASGVALLLPYWQKYLQDKDVRQNIREGMAQELIENIKRGLFKGEITYQSVFFHTLKINPSLVSNWELYRDLSEIYLYMDYITVNASAKEIKDKDDKYAAYLYMKISLISKTCSILNKNTKLESYEEIMKHITACVDVGKREVPKIKVITYEECLNLVGIIMTDKYLEVLRPKLVNLFTKL